MIRSIKNSHVNLVPTLVPMTVENVCRFELSVVNIFYKVEIIKWNSTATHV